MSDENEALVEMYMSKPVKGASPLTVHKDHQQRARKPIDGRRGRTRGIVKVTVQLNVRVEPAQRDFIIEEAVEDGRTISEFLLAAVEAYVATKGRTRKSP